MFVSLWTQISSWRLRNACSIFLQCESLWYTYFTNKSHVKSCEKQASLLCPNYQPKKPHLDSIFLLELACTYSKPTMSHIFFQTVHTQHFCMGKCSISTPLVYVFLIHWTCSSGNLFSHSNEVDSHWCVRRWQWTIPKEWQIEVRLAVKVPSL